MRDFFNLKTLITTVIIIILAVSISIILVHNEFKKSVKEVMAGGVHNMSGWAWNENVGWISFNCTDEVCIDPISYNILEGYYCYESACYDSGGNPYGAGSCHDTCIVCENDGSKVCDATGSNPAICGPGYNCIENGLAGEGGYGVNIDKTTGDFSGYAWSPYVGWIDFAPSSPYPGDPQYNHAARLIISADPDHNKKVGGWAKILSMGDDGWIKMTGTSTTNDPFGVTLNIYNSKMSGWAWNANNDGSGIGWVSFKNSNYQIYGFFNTEPDVSFPVMSDPGHCDYDCACTFRGALTPQLRWNFIDPDPNSSQTYYQVLFHTDNIIDPETVTDGSGMSLPLKTSKLSGSASSFFPDNNVYYRDVTIDYDEDYYWWVRVWDNYGASSTWVQFDDPTNPDGDGSRYTFTTYEHEFPDVDYTWFPDKPSQGEEVEFYSDCDRNPSKCSKIYLTGPGIAEDCDDDKCDWEWTFPVGTTDILGDLTASTTIVRFNSPGEQVVTLKVTNKDSTVYYCSKSDTVSGKLELPTWKEVKSE